MCMGAVCVVPAASLGPPERRHAGPCVCSNPRVPSSMQGHAPTFPRRSSLSLFQCNHRPACEACHAVIACDGGVGHQAWTRDRLRSRGRRWRLLLLPLLPLSLPPLLSLLPLLPLSLLPLLPLSLLCRGPSSPMCAATWCIATVHKDVVTVQRRGASCGRDGAGEVHCARGYSRLDRMLWCRMRWRDGSRRRREHPAAHMLGRLTGVAWLRVETRRALVELHLRGGERQSPHSQRCPRKGLLRRLAPRCALHVAVGALWRRLRLVDRLLVYYALPLRPVMHAAEHTARSYEQTSTGRI